MVVPSPPFTPGPPVQPGPEMQQQPKDTLRKAALDARKAFVRTLSDADRILLERRLAEHLTSLCAGCAVVGGYAPIGSEISPLIAMEEARAVGSIVAFPAFDHPAKPFRFRAGDPLQPGPFGMMQPKLNAPVVEPDLILVPLLAIDSRGTRLGRGKGHYDRALTRLKKTGARLVGIGWANQRVTGLIPADDWDVPLQGFASPDGIEWFAEVA
ncbi:5-formyltetrahydrofolate cyclo-ligase [Sphingomonas sp. F9_3S_D5_B_2]